MTLIDIRSSPELECRLAFAAAQGVTLTPGRLAALAAEPDSAAFAHFNLTVFKPIWEKQQPAYAAATLRLREKLAAHPRADLGALFGFDVAIDLQHLGLRQRVGAARRIAPDRIAAVLLCPSAFNPDRHWHLEATGSDNRQIVHLPVHDAILGAACRPLLMPTKPAAPRLRSEIDVRSAEVPVATLFKALGDSSRFAMVEMLARAELTGAEIGRRLGLSNPAITHHLNELRRAGLVDERREGAAIHLTLRRSVFDNLSAMSLAHLFGIGPVATPQRSRRRKRFPS